MEAVRLRRDHLNIHGKICRLDRGEILQKTEINIWIRRRTLFYEHKITYVQVTLKRFGNGKWIDFRKVDDQFSKSVIS